MVVREAIGENKWESQPPTDQLLNESQEQTRQLETVEQSAAQSLTPGSIYVHDTHLEALLGELFGKDRVAEAAAATAEAIETASSYHETPVGEHAVPLMREDEGVSDVQPVHLRDISESILKDKAGTESDRKSTRLNSSHVSESRMPSSA